MYRVAKKQGKILKIIVYLVNIVKQMTNQTNLKIVLQNV